MNITLEEIYLTYIQIAVEIHRRLKEKYFEVAGFSKKGTLAWRVLSQCYELSPKLSFTCLNPKIETLEKGLKYVQN